MWHIKVKKLKIKGTDIILRPVDDTEWWQGNKAKMEIRKVKKKNNKNQLRHQEGVNYCYDQTMNELPTHGSRSLKEEERIKMSKCRLQCLSSALLFCAICININACTFAYAHVYYVWRLIGAVVVVIACFVLQKIAIYLFCCMRLAAVGWPWKSHFPQNRFFSIGTNRPNPWSIFICTLLLFCRHVHILFNF